MSSETSVAVENLRKEYGDLTAVKDANFELATGEFVSILGPSGSGKSTILRMIAGFESATSGTVTVAGFDITNDPPFERNTNMVFQDLALFPHLTVGENIEYGLKQQGIKKDERKQSIKEMLTMVQLEGYADRDISELSGGEQQRVALARSIVNEPEVVLFDEPLASLDRKLRQHMQFELQRIQEETGITFLYVTHDQEIALSISDRMVILNDGHIEQVGSVEELYETPATQFVADFLGDINAIQVHVTQLSDNTVTFTADNLTLTCDQGDVTLPGNTNLQEGDHGTVAIRPHNVRLSADPSEGLISGRVQNRMYRGNETAYIVATDWDEFLVIDDTLGTTLDIGTTVSLGWDMNDVFVFVTSEEVSKEAR
ncbi:ABC transporter ATP-binding protein [Halalkalicoccus jeotgali]|nr:ABC transporter ATP-binding protein [Halalkalicoccus jeotgali]